MTQNKHMIWTSEVDLDDWKGYIEESYEAYINKEEPTSFSLSIDNYLDFTTHNNSEPSFEEYFEKYQNDIYEEIQELNNYYLEDARINLGIQTETEGEIICIADIGRWNGRASGYYIEGNSISDCLHSHVNGTSDIEFFVEKEGKTLEFKATEYHHDATNYYLYRELKPDLSEKQVANFTEKIINGEASKTDINRYTRPLGQEIQKVYGFELGNKKQKETMDRE